MICGGQNGTGTGFYSGITVFRCQYQFDHAFTFIFLSPTLYNIPFSVKSSVSIMPLLPPTDISSASKDLCYCRPDGLGGLVVSMLASGTQVCGVQTRPKPLDFYGRKNPQRAFLRRGSKRICPMSQLCGMSKNLIIYMNYGLLAKFQV